MTVIVGLNNVLASDGACLRRNFATGTGRPAVSVGKLHTLSDRLAFGSFGMSWWPGGSVGAVAEETRLEIAAGAPLSVEDAGRLLAANLHRAAGPMLARITAQRWPVPAGVPVGSRPWCGFIGGLLLGFNPDDNDTVECWFFCVTAAEIEEPVLKYRAGPGQWGVAISPGADHAIAAYKRIVRDYSGPADTVPMAAAIVQAQIDGHARSPSPHGSYAGPVQILTLIPGRPPVAGRAA